MTVLGNLLQANTQKKSTTESKHLENKYYVLYETHQKCIYQKVLDFTVVLPKQLCIENCKQLK